MSHKDAPPLTDEQIRMEAWYVERLASRGAAIAWGRDKHGEYLSEFARDAWAAWRAAPPASLVSERDVLRNELEKVNNEFGSQTAHWPDAWRRVADIKQCANRRWQSNQQLRQALQDVHTASTFFESDPDQMAKLLTQVVEITETALAIPVVV